MHNEQLDDGSSGGLFAVGKSTSLWRFHHSDKVSSARHVSYMFRNISGNALTAVFIATLGMLSIRGALLFLILLFSRSNFSRVIGGMCSVSCFT